MKMTYDYPALKADAAKLDAAIEHFDTVAKNVKERGEELVAENNAEGVKSTMSAMGEKVDGMLKSMNALRDQIGNQLAMAKELHIANGGDE